VEGMIAKASVPLSAQMSVGPLQVGLSAQPRWLDQNDQVATGVLAPVLAEQ